MHPNQQESQMNRNTGHYLKNPMSRAVSLALKGLVVMPVIMGSAHAQQMDNSDKMQKIEITGSAIRRTDAESPSPVQIINRESIQQSGLQSVSDVIRAISADNSGSIPNAFGTGFAAGSAGVALRGLTVNSTLVLIDGRRAAAYALADDGQRSFVDLNTIPLDAVDRIEVLKDGASSIYGADAIAGVVNVILRKSFVGNTISAEAGVSGHSDGGSAHMSATFGRGDLDTDKYNAYINIEYNKDNKIYAKDRGFPFNTADLTSIGGPNLAGGQPGQYSGSIYGSVTPGTLGTPGNLLTGIPNTGALAQPLRACGAGTTQVTDPAQGTYCQSNGVSPNAMIQDAQERVNLFTRFTAQINADTQAYISAGYFQNQTKVPGAYAQIQTSTPTNTNSIALPPVLANGQLNPNNPFAAQGQYALINYAFGDIPNESSYTNHVMRLVGGIRGEFAGWDYDSAVVINHTSLDTAIRGAISYSALLNAIQNGTYSFINPASNSAAVRNSLSPGVFKTSTTDMDSIDLKLNREIGKLEGGAIGIAVGGEVRHEAQNDPNFNPNLDTQGYGAAQTIGSRNIFGLYGEINLPVLKTLEIDVAGRYDHYSDVGTSTTPKIGFKYTPLKALSVRGTYSQGFRAPSFSENGSSSALGFQTFSPSQDLVNAHNNNGYVQPYQIGVLSSANKNIQPEKADSFTLGLVMEPTNWLNFSIDYYDITKKNLIVQPSVGPAIAALSAGQPLPAGYSVIFDNPDPAYPSAPLRPIQIIGQYANANSLHTNGVDVDLRTKFNLGNYGKLTTELTWTNILSFKQFNTDGTVYSFAGTEGPYSLSSGAGTPRNRGSLYVTWNQGPLTLSGITNYVSGFSQTAADASPGCLTTWSPFADRCHVASFTTFDVTGEYKVSKQLELSFGIANLFDRTPPFNPANYAANNYNPTYAQSGIVGRYFRVGAKYSF